MHVRQYLSHGQYLSRGQAIFDRLGKSNRKGPETMFTRKKDPDPKPPFSKDPLSRAFSKSSVLIGAQAISKSSGYVRIRVTVYPGSKGSVFEKTRIRVHVALVSL